MTISHLEIKWKWGQIIVKYLLASSGYYNLHQTTEEFILDDSFQTGDLDEDGYFFVDRKKG